MLRPTKEFNWRRVESADYREYISNLVAIGCPSETVADIIVADVNKLYDERGKNARDTFPKQAKFQFWRSASDYKGETPLQVAALKARLLEIDAERRQVLTELLGDAATDDKPSPAPKNLAWNTGLPTRTVRSS